MIQNVQEKTLWKVASDSSSVFEQQLNEYIKWCMMQF